MYKRIAAILAVLVAAVVVGLYAATQASTTASASGTAPKTETGPVTKVTICHFTSEHSSHPYNELETPAFQFVYGVGHGDHKYDIWPSFKFKTKDGKIVTVPEHGDQSILRNHCKIPGEECDGEDNRGGEHPCPTETVSPCPTVTVTVTATPTVNPQKTHPTEHPTQCPTATATATVTTTTTATATATVTGPTSTVTVTAPPGPFVPSTGCPAPNLYNAIRGNAKPNNMVGTPCRDVMAGHGGGDTMFGAAETDIMIGGRGNDSINGGTSPDILRGGFGNDSINAVDGQPGDRIVGGIGKDVCYVDPGDISRQCERIVKK